METITISKILALGIVLSLVSLLYGAYDKSEEVRNGLPLPFLIQKIDRSMSPPKLVALESIPLNMALDLLFWIIISFLFFERAMLRRLWPKEHSG